MIALGWNEIVVSSWYLLDRSLDVVVVVVVVVESFTTFSFQNDSDDEK